MLHTCGGRAPAGSGGTACPCPAKAHVLPRPPLATGRGPRLPRPLVTSRRLLCPQTDTSDPEKVVSAFLKVSSVFKDEASVRTAVQDAVGACGGWPRQLRPLRCPGLGSERCPPICSSSGSRRSSGRVLASLFFADGEPEALPKAIQFYTVRTRARWCPLQEGQTSLRRGDES